MTQNTVRVRFAPSPTGPLHMGGVRTALFNYLFAKNNNGVFILRVEDTDQKRYEEGAEQYIIDSLKWCGIEIEEGVNEGGNYGPYRQSERKEIYQKYIDILVKNGSAYYAFDTPSELETMRKNLKVQKRSNQQYNAETRSVMRNSLTLSSDEVNKLIESGHPYVIRFNMPENETIEVIDKIRGKVVFNTSILDDKVLFKSDGMPTYHLANIVDDHLMEITHVIRGEEWLPSLPLHVLLYKAFAWEDTMPEFSHLPLLLKPNGKGKLSKRDGDKMGFPVFPLEWINSDNEISQGYRENGYFPEAFVNLLALLGWNPGTEKEIYSMNELINDFSLEKVGKSGSKFDPDKAKWFNQQYLRQYSDNELAIQFDSLLKKKNINCDLEKTEKICSLVKERLVFIKDFWEQTSFFYVAPNEYDAKVVRKRWKANSPIFLKEIIQKLNNINEFISPNIENEIKKHILDNSYSMGQVLNVLRLVIVGASKGPHLFDILEVLGKNESIIRIENGIKNIKK